MNVQRPPLQFHMEPGFTNVLHLPGSDLGICRVSMVMDSKAGRLKQLKDFLTQKTFSKGDFMVLW